MWPPEGRRVWVALLGLAAIQAGLVLIVPSIPTNDGAAHAYNAALLLHWNDPAWADVVAAYELDLRPVPNWTGHLLLAALQAVVDPILADKLLLAAYTLALPLTAAWALRQVRPGAELWAILTLPLVHGVAFHMGFLNFCLGTVLWWAMAGVWWRTRDGPALRRSLALGGLGLALYFTHGLVWTAAWGALGVFAIVGRRPRELAVLAAAAAPSAVLLALFAGGSGEGLMWVLDAGQRARDLLGLETLVSLDPRERWAAALFGLLLVASVGAGLHATRDRPVDERDGWLVLLVVVLLGYFVAPDGVGGATFIHVRAMLFLLFAAVGVVAVRPPGGRTEPALWIAAAVAMLLFMGPRDMRWWHLGDAIADQIEALDVVGEGTVVVGVLGGRSIHEDAGVDFPWRIRPFTHVVGFAAARRPLRAFPNYEAGTGHFPLRWADGRDPRPELQNWLRAPPPLDLPGWEARTGERIEWVLLTGHPVLDTDTALGWWVAERFRPAGGDSLTWALFRRLPD